ncbi:MAG: hypothetical protein V1750_04335 [Acidobacteriota bacterium]
MRPSNHARCMTAVAVLVLTALLASTPAQAGFSARELFVPGVGRTSGANNSQWYSTLWVSNVSTTTPVDVEIFFLKANQANPAPVPYRVTLAAGETRRFPNCVEALFGETAASGTLRVTGTGDITVAARTYDQPTSTSLRGSKGYFYNGIPASFAIGINETTFLQGLLPASVGDFRYNFALTETTGQGGAEPTKVMMTLRDATGASLGAKEYSLGAWEVTKQLRVDQVFPQTSAAEDAVLEAAVTGGPGKVILSGSLIAGESNDSAGVEMMFRSSLLAANSETTLANLLSSVSTTVLAVSERLLAIAAQVMLSGTYDEATGWWTVSFELSDGRKVQAQVQFRNAAGEVQKIYNPLTTTTILAKGSAVGSQGTVSFDLTITGVNTGSSSITINGTGTGTYQGVSGSFTVTSVVVPKAADSYPTSGTITVTSGPATVTVTFDGTQYAKGTYTVGPVTRQFTIDLATGTVTWL